jgi:hypothetical protein
LKAVLEMMIVKKGLTSPKDERAEKNLLQPSTEEK